MYKVFLKSVLSVVLALTAFAAVAQERTITGTVKDETGEPLIGAAVIVDGTGNAVITDIDGKFSLNGVPAGAKLNISFTGMKDILLEVGENTTYDLVMYADTQFLEEIVVVGYSTTTKKKLVGSVTNLSGEVIEKTSFNNVTEALQGNMPGLIVQAAGGSMDATPNISIRGGEKPLFVIDGVVSSEMDFSLLNPEDIESISLLKDASATAVYGSRAGAGIVQVTTKRGGDGKPVVKYSTNLQLSQPTRLFDYVDSFEYVDNYNQAYKNDGIADPYMTEEDRALIGKDYRYPNNNFTDMIFRKAVFQQQHNISLSGGNKNTKYYVSVGYRDNNGMLKIGRANADRMNYRASLSHNFDKIGLEVGTLVNGYVRRTDEPLTASTDEFLKRVAHVPPLAVCFNPDGTLADADQNFLREIAPGAGYSKKRHKAAEYQLYLNWKPTFVKGLTLGVMGNYYDSSYFVKTWDAYAPSYVWDEETQTSERASLAMKPSLNVKSGYGRVFDLEARIAYQRTFNDHTIDILALYTQTMGDSDFVEAGRVNYKSDVIDQMFAGPLEGMQSNGYYAENARAGFVGRIKYDWKSRYIVEVSARYDGTDQFAKGHRWGLFPAVSGVWMISEEPFMKNLKDKKIIDLLKIRASYGVTGLTEGIGRFGFLPSYNVQKKYENFLDINDQIHAGFVEGNLVSPEALTWYTRKSLNYGFDFGFFNNTLSGSFDYFYYQTTGFLTSPDVDYSGTLGTALPKVKSNSEHRRDGVEFTLRYKKNWGDWDFQIGGNISYFNELWAQDDTENLASLKNPYIRKTQQTDYFGIVYPTNGLYNSIEDVLGAPRPLTSENSSLGEINYVDANGDGKIDINDMRRSGHSIMPHIIYGLDFSASWKGLTLSALFQGVGQRTVHIGNMYQYVGAESMTIRSRVDGAWTPENMDKAQFPRIFSNPDVNGKHNGGYTSDICLKSGSYFRLKNLTLSYDFKKVLLKNTKAISSFQVSLIGTNLFTVSDVFKYMDPEAHAINVIETGDARSISGASYPVHRTFSLGINIGF